MRLRPFSEVLKDRRRSPRTPANCLQLAYWDGSSVLRRIREVSSHGAFVETQNQWCAGTVLRTHLIAELPLPVLSEGVAQGVSTPENGAPESSSHHKVLHTKSARLTETVSIPVTCRVVRLVDEGICVDFVHRSKKQRLAVESFLMTVKERTRTGEANAREATAPQPTNETLVPEALKDVFGGLLNVRSSCCIRLSRSFICSGVRCLGSAREYKDSNGLPTTSSSRSRFFPWFPPPRNRERLPQALWQSLRRSPSSSTRSRRPISGFPGELASRSNGRGRSPL